jgi:hypothetical protein
MLIPRQLRCGTHYLVALAAAVLALVPASKAQAGEAHYLMVFGSQRIPNEPAYSHSFATFVRACWPGNGPCPERPKLEAYTISWLPRALPLRLYVLEPECGRNYGLDETIQYALASCERVSMWGPYQIEPELYGRTARQVGLLCSGRVKYKALDSGYPSDKVSNCIHAVSSISEGYRVRVASPGWGEVASYAILQEFEPWIVNRCQLHPWVGSALGLDQYPMIYRDWTGPRSGALYGPLYRLLGGEKNLQATYGPPSR